MSTRPPRPALWLFVFSWCYSAGAQTAPDEFRVYTEHPRLLLRPQRLRLLKRERARQSMRWKQFETLIASGAEMPEPGFAWALYHAVTGDAAAAKHAVDWALGQTGQDLRQLAIVYDWCQDSLTEAQSKAVVAKIQRQIAKVPSGDVIAQRGRVEGAIAIAEVEMDSTEKTLRSAIEGWWRGPMAKSLENGRDLDSGAELYALCELLHVVRDNLTIDLRLAAPGYFKDLPGYQIVSNYPNAYTAAPENEYWIPVFKGSGEPDPNRAALARAAGLATVAFDSNAIGNQYLQGWLIQDRFMLRGTFGAPYEFLWANPYQPGLTYEHVPLVFHDARSGTLFLRSSWDEDASWFGLYHGEAQLYRDGKITILNQSGPRSATPKPILIGGATVLLAREGLRFQTSDLHMFVVGWKPRMKYDVEVDDEEMREVVTDAAGTMELEFPEGRNAGVRIQEVALGRK